MDLFLKKNIKIDAAEPVISSFLIHSSSLSEPCAYITHNETGLHSLDCTVIYSTKALRASKTQTSHLIFVWLVHLRCHRHPLTVWQRCLWRKKYLKILTNTNRICCISSQCSCILNWKAWRCLQTRVKWWASTAENNILLKMRLYACKNILQIIEPPSFCSSHISALTSFISHLKAKLLLLLWPNAG